MKLWSRLCMQAMHAGYASKNRDRPYLMGVWFRNPYQLIANDRLCYGGNKFGGKRSTLNEVIGNLLFFA